MTFWAAATGGPWSRKSQAIAAVGSFFGGKVKNENAIVQNLIGNGAEIVARGLDKDAEYEADRIGLVLGTRAGYDAYAPAFADPAALTRTYDCVVSQDVVEHVADPRALLATFDRLCRPGGVIAIGTPDASGIDLGFDDCREIVGGRFLFREHRRVFRRFTGAGQ